MSFMKWCVLAVGVLSMAFIVFGRGDGRRNGLLVTVIALEMWLGVQLSEILEVLQGAG